MNDHKEPVGASEIFLKSWKLYQKIIHENYMFHREISEALRSASRKTNTNQGLNIFDLGCGDASMAIPLLSRGLVQSYSGCDLSKPALEIAHSWLKEQDIEHKLLCDDMCKVISELPDKSFDIVFSSYAIHHLNATQKRLLIKEISRTLRPSGQFILIDIFREPSETRADYMAHYMSAIRETWVNLSESEQALVANHATEYDFPEQTDFYENTCLKNGFSSGVNLAKHTWHQAWLFSKPN